MAWEDIRHALGLWTANADLTGAQYKFVKLTGGQQVALASVAGEKCIGVLQSKPDINRSAQILDCAGGGVSKVVASAAIAMYADVTTTNDGRAATAGAGNEILGIALEPAATAGDIIAVLLCYRGKA